MAFPRGKLTKLAIIFSSDEKKPLIGIPFFPMYNPESYKMDYQMEYDTNQRLIVGDADKKFLRVRPKILNLKLYFDGTSASPNDLLISNLEKVPGFNGVVAQVEAFLAMAASVGSIETDAKLREVVKNTNNEIHRPKGMAIIWGTFYMTGVLIKASVNYTMFTPEGVPIRAEMEVDIAESTSLTLVERAMKLMSPDLSKSIVVKEGDTLPDLCYKEYGDATFYPKIAEVNQLKNFRKLVPGTELLFPPIK
jgi:nucleoid-associated protein YgaU